MTQGYPISLTILNVVVDMVISNWVTVVAVMEETADPITKGFRWDIQRLAAYLHADDGFMASTRSHRLQ